MRLTRLERHAQRLAWAEQVLLADDFVDIARAQALGQRHSGTVGGRRTANPPRYLGLSIWCGRRKRLANATV
jgi:hypothetical protein